MTEWQGVDQDWQFAIERDEVKIQSLHGIDRATFTLPLKVLEAINKELEIQKALRYTQYLKLEMEFEPERAKERQKGSG